MDPGSRLSRSPLPFSLSDNLSSLGVSSTFPPSRSYGMLRSSITIHAVQGTRRSSRVDGPLASKHDAGEGKKQMCSEGEKICASLARSLIRMSSAIRRPYVTIVDFVSLAHFKSATGQSINR